MRRIFALAAATLLLAAPARAAYLNYGQWSALSPPERSLYIAGAYDQFTTIKGAGADAAGVNLAERYDGCLTRVRMTNVQLAENLRAFGAGKPELQAAPVPVALMQYLAVTCGSL